MRRDGCLASLFFAKAVANINKTRERKRIMKNILSVENMRKSDAHTIETGIPGRELMMRAARGVFENVDWKAPVAIVCGSGNNAGDGYALALCLNEAGPDCTVICVYDRYSEDGRYYFDKCREAGITVVTWADEASDPFAGYNTVVDCLLGTGFKGDVREDLKGVISAINESGAYIVSIDINSGLTAIRDLRIHVSDPTLPYRSADSNRGISSTRPRMLWLIK